MTMDTGTERSTGKVQSPLRCMDIELKHVGLCNEGTRREGCDGLTGLNTVDLE